MKNLYAPTAPYGDTPVYGSPSPSFLVQQFSLEHFEGIAKLEFFRQNFLYRDAACYPKPGGYDGGCVGDI